MQDHNFLSSIAASLSLIIVSLSTMHSCAADERVALKIGDSAPGWNMLAGTDGMAHSMNELADRDVLIVCFTCNTCPYSVDYEDRLIALQQKFQKSGVSAQLVAINSNAVSGDTLEKMKERSVEKSFNFPYLRDEDQTVAKSWGAIFTPEFYVLNKDRRIVYMGALDDSTKAENVTKRYVELAVDAAMKGTSPEVSKTAPRGCQVRYKRERRSKASQ